MSSYLAPAPAPRQLDIIADTLLAADRKMAAIRQPEVKSENGSHSSTAPPRDDGSHSSTTVASVEKRRQQLGISKQKLCSAAGIHFNTYRFALEGHAKSRAETLQMLDRALDRFAAGHTADKRLTFCESYLRNLTTQLAERGGWDPELMLSQDYRSENTNDPVWLQASRLRRCAIYLLVEGKLCGKAEIGRVIGVSRQAVHKSVAAIEAERERSSAFDVLMGSMMLQVSGKRL